MSKITTGICKDYLINFYRKQGVETQEKDWKRTKKYLNGDGEWIRIFSHVHIGDVSLLENKNGTISVLEEKSTLNTPIVSHGNSKSFDLRVFTENQIKDAWKVYKKYYSDTEDVDDEFIKKYQEKIRYIPGILNWYVPLDAYKNEELQPKQINWQFNMKGYNLCMFDLKNFHEYGGEEYLLNGCIPDYLSKMDEYHYEIIKDITVEDLVRDLSSLGYKHANTCSGEVSAIKKIMSTISYNKIPYVLSALEQDILNNNISQYNFKELEGARINNHGIFLFSFLHEKYNVLEHLIENRVSIPKYDLDRIIEKSYFKDEAINPLMKIILNYDNIILGNNEIHILTNILYSQKAEELMEQIFRKYANDDNVLYFASNKKIISNPSHNDIFVKRFSRHDEELSEWIRNNLVIPKSDLSILTYPHIRGAITKELISKILDEGLKEHAEDANYHTNRGLTVVEQYSDGSSMSWAKKSQIGLAQFIINKNKILSYFENNNDDDTPKKVYRTKF